MAEKRPNNYFDDIPTSHRQIKVFMIIVLAYIFYAWRAIDRRPLTADELEETEHKY